MLNIIRLRMLKFRDEYFIMLIMTVLALAFTFVFTLSQTEGNGVQKIGIIDESNSPFTQEIISEIERSGNYYSVILNKEDMLKQLKDRELPFSLYFDESFDKMNLNVTVIRGIESMEGVQAINDLTNLINNQVIVDDIVDQISLGFTDINKDEIKTQYQHNFEQWQTYSIKTTNFGESVWKDFDFLMHLLIGFNIMFSMYTMIFGMGDILTDRKLLTFQRVMVTPIKKSDFIIGNLISTMFFGFVQMTIVLFGGQLLFGVNWGDNILGVLLIIFTFIFTVSAMGLMLSNVVKTMGQLGAMTPIIITGTSMLGGCMWPLEIVNSKVLLFLSNFTPQKWTLEGIKNLAMYNYGMESIIVPIAVLLLMGSVFLILGIYFLDKSELSFST